MDKNDFKKFLNESNVDGVIVLKINSIEVDQFDSDYGFIGENYILNFDGEKRIENSIEIGTTVIELTKKNVYVNIKLFKQWMNNKKGIQFEL